MVSECAIVWRVCECAMVRVVSSVYECMASVWRVCGECVMSVCSECVRLVCGVCVCGEFV